MHRFFVSASDLEEDRIALPDEVRRHLAVLRAKADEEILLLDGTGTLCRCRLEARGKSVTHARTLVRWREEETAFPVHLLQSLPKGEKMELILQKGTELGMAAFTPILTARSIPSRGKNREENRQQRWNRIMREAARQCRRPVLPRLVSPQPLAEALATCGDALRLVLWEEESRPLAEVLPEQPPRSAAILVGPEGGLDPADVAAARQAGFVPVRFGPRILRCETAGFAVATVLQYRYGDLGSTQRVSEPAEPPQ